MSEHTTTPAEGTADVAERPRPIRSKPSVLFPLAALGIFFIIWDVTSVRQDVLLFPRVVETFLGIARLLSTADLWVAFGLSNLALLIGYVAAIVIGIPIGLAIGRSPLLDKGAGPYLTVLVVLPTAAITPLIVMAVGLKLTGNASLVFLFCFPMLILNTRSAARTLDRGLIEMAQCYLADRRAMWRFVVLPGSLVGVFAGLRLGLGRAITGMVIGELLLVATGIGGLILRYQGFFMGPELFAIIFLVCVESFSLARGVTKLEEKLIPWKTERKS
jgi:ABC-type nitrate/sulfonate/bicarbonate transport system permease component